MILRCIAIDDEKHALELLQLYCDKNDRIDLIAATTDPWEAKKLIEGEKPDLLLLDIQMPELTGLQLLDIVDHKFDVIITSAYPNYAIDGYRYEVGDYLLKPFSYDRFAEAVERIQTRRAGQKTESEQPKESSGDFLMVKGDRNAFHKVKLAEILFIEGLKNYVRYHTPTDKIITLTTMTEAETQLPSAFQRIHRSYIVNMDRVDGLEGNQVRIGEKLLPIGGTYKSEVLRRLGL